MDERKSESAWASEREVVSGGVAAGVLVDPSVVAMIGSTERRSAAERNSVGEDNGVDAGVAKFAVDVADNFAGFAGALVDEVPDAADGVVGEVAVGWTTFSKSGIDDQRSFNVVTFVRLVTGIALGPTVGAKEAPTENGSESVSISAGAAGTLGAVECALTGIGGTAVRVEGLLAGAAEVGLASDLTLHEEGSADMAEGGAGFRWLSIFDFLDAPFVSDDTNDCAFLFRAMAMASGDRLSITEARTTLASSSNGYVQFSLPHMTNSTPREIANVLMP